MRGLTIETAREIIRKAAVNIAAEAESLDLNYWGHSVIVHDDGERFFASYIDDLAEPTDCGTAACFAGHIAYAARELFVGGSWHISTAAAAVLDAANVQAQGVYGTGLDYDLFGSSTDGWPSEYRDRLGYDPSNAEIAEVAIAMLVDIADGEWIDGSDDE